MLFLNVIAVSFGSYFKNWSSTGFVGIGRHYLYVYDYESTSNGFLSDSSFIPGISFKGLYSRIFKSIYCEISADYSFSSRDRYYMYSYNNISENKESIKSPCSNGGEFIMKIGSWVLLHDSDDSNSLYSGDKNYYFSGDPGIGCIYLFSGFRVMSIESSSQSVKFSSKDLLLGIGSKMYSGASNGSHSVIVSANLGASIYSSVVILNIDNSHHYKTLKEVSPLCIFDISIGRYLTLGLSMHVVISGTWESLIWVNDDISWKNATLININIVCAKTG